MTMSYNELDDAITVARRFIHHAKRAQSRLVIYNVDKRLPSIYSTKETAQARRASMNLTRALADLRRI